MGLLSAGAGKKTQITTYSGLQVQSTSTSLPVPIVYGQNVITPNIIDYVDFRKVASGGGKGGGKGGHSSSSASQSYTYYATVIMALCEGPINGVNRVWTGTVSPTYLGQLGLGLTAGNLSQAPWSYMSSRWSARALAYNGTAYVYAVNYSLGASASVGNNSMEVAGLLYGTGFNGVDADPAQVLYDFLTNINYGCGFPTASIDWNSIFGYSGDGSYQTYCWAAGIAISPALVSQESASSIVAR